MHQYQSRDTKSNRDRTITYALALAVIATLVLVLAALAVKGMSPVSGQAPSEPPREFEIGDIARFVVGGGAVHEGPIVAYELTSDNQWVYDVAYGNEGSVWESLEEYRILEVTEDSMLYQPRVEGYPVKIIDLATGEKVGEGIVQGGEELDTVWHYLILVSTCEVIRPPEGLTIVLVNNLVEPFECTEVLDCPTPEKPDEPTATPEPTPEEEATPTSTPEPTPTPTPTPTPESPTPTPEPEPTPTEEPTEEPDEEQDATEGAPAVTP
jgi:hypothetical protein